MPVPVPIVSNDQNTQVAHHFEHLDLRNPMVPSMRLSAAGDGANDINDQKIMLHLNLIS